MTRGFVTLTTGSDKYYRMAVNMLRSFRYHNPDAKMAILCDKENEYTAEFDDVVVLDNVQGSYKDKFRLLTDCPYDENIFIEPDCFIYRNLDFFWDILSAESDYSSFGWNNSPLNIWFKSDEALREIKKYLTDIEAFPLFNPGYFFIRNGEKCKKMYHDCMDISDYIMSNPILKTDKTLLCNGKLRDDPVLSLAMEVNGFVCNAKPKIGKCIFLPSKYKINAIDFKNGVLNVTDSNGNEFTDCSMIHFSTRKANEEGLYLWQKNIIRLVSEGKKGMVLKISESKLALLFCNIYMKLKTKFKSIFK